MNAIRNPLNNLVAIHKIALLHKQVFLFVVQCTYIVMISTQNVLIFIESRPLYTYL